MTTAVAGTIPQAEGAERGGVPAEEGLPDARHRQGVIVQVQDLEGGEVAEGRSFNVADAHCYYACQLLSRFGLFRETRSMRDPSMV